MSHTMTFSLKDLLLFKTQEAAQRINAFLGGPKWSPEAAATRRAWVEQGVAKEKTAELAVLKERASLFLTASAIRKSGIFPEDLRDFFKRQSDLRKAIRRGQFRNHVKKKHGNFGLDTAIVHRAYWLLVGMSDHDLSENKHWREILDSKAFADFVVEHRAKVAEREEARCRKA